MKSQAIIVVGGGAAGFFAAIACAEASPGACVIVLERGSQLLSKVRISGGGRCNVTHACFDSREFTTGYPRGSQALIGAFKQFQASDTVAWFESRGVRLKTENDGRMFPTTDSSETIIECLLKSARAANISIRTNCGVDSVRRNGDQFELTTAGGETIVCDKLLLATGGCRAAVAGELATSLGHTIESPVPSLFTFHIESPWLRSLSGVAIEDAELRIAEARLNERGPLLVTHWGLSGPAILKMSAWGARKLHSLDYKFPLLVNWLPQQTPDSLASEISTRRNAHGAKLVVNVPIAPLTSRLWEALVLAVAIRRDTRWSALTSAQRHQLVLQLSRTEFAVTGKSLNKDEFVTCGGVKLAEVNFKTMESRICPGLFFAGELLDIDGITGGFNFQAAWTTGWIAGNAMAEVPPVQPR